MEFKDKLGIAEDTRELLSRSIISKGINGKHNRLICFDDRQSFLKKTQSIAWSALLGQIGSSYYTDFGLNGIEPSEFTQLHNEIPILTLLNNVNHYKEIFKEGKKDYLIRFGSNTIAYCWLPSLESIGEHRLSRNILIAQCSPEALQIIENQIADDPKMIYELLISSLYPNALIPLSETEILNAVQVGGKELIRINNNPELAAKYKAGMTDEMTQISNVQPKSVLKRLAPCEEVELVGFKIPEIK